MTKAEFFSRFTKKAFSVKVQDSQTLEWLKPSHAYKVKTMYSADMALFTPIKY
jgi:hypothetical protein